VPVFADESSSAILAVVAVLSGVLGGAITWAANWCQTQRLRRRQWAKDDEKGIVDRQDTLSQRQGEQIKDLQGRVDRVSNRLTTVIAHMMYLEGLLRAKDIAFTPFDRDSLTGSSGHHVADGEGGP